MIVIETTSSGDDVTHEVESNLVENIRKGHLWLTYKNGEPVVQMTETGRLYVERMMKSGHSS